MKTTLTRPLRRAFVALCLPFAAINPVWAQTPVPTITSITPDNATAGDLGFTLTVNGTGFNRFSTVRWNGADRVTDRVTTTQLSATIPAADIAAAGVANVTVFTPAPGGGTSTPVPFTINAPPSVAPVITSINPTSAFAGAPGFTLVVAGNNFVGGSTVQWNGSPRPSVFTSPTQLAATISAADIAVPGTASVTVVNPSTAPGGGTPSNAVPFTVVAPAPAPTLTALNPNAAFAGGPGFNLIVAGANFAATTVVRWNGANRATTYISPTQLSALIPATDMATVGAASVTAFTPPTGGAGGGTSNPLNFTVNPAPNPAPTLTNLSQSHAPAGSPGFTLTLTGTNFATRSVAQWNGSPRPTTVISPTQLTVMVLASDLAAVGGAAVTVFNPAPGGGTSNALSFNVVTAPNPAPTITTLNPNTVAAGGAGFALTVLGTNFVSGSVVRWNGADRPTTFVSATQLVANIPPSDFATPGAATISVFNPAPGGGQSNQVRLTIVNPAPTLTSVLPNSVVAGSPGAQLIVTGSGFVPGSVVQLNGTPRPTTFVSATQLAATLAPADVLNAGAASVNVVNPAPGGGTSAASPFTVTPRPLPQPTLMSVATNVVAQGARQVRLTLVGSNFRPGARVVIGQSPSNPSLTPATDVAVESVVRISDNALLAVVSLSNQASLTARSGDVVNADNSSTGPAGSRTTQALRIERSTSLAAPLQVMSVAVTHPRNGTVIAQGDHVTAEAVIAGAGTGTILGQWLWDGNAVEQFAVTLTGGERRTLKTSNPLPTAFLGPHTLELRITYPNLIQTPQLNVVVNPGTWKLTRLLAPATGAGFTQKQPPTLRWAIVPGAARYQVGFATEPHFRAVRQWFDVADTEWRVPEKIWEAQPEGELYWTVRVVEMSGETRQPSLLRRIQRVADDALAPVSDVVNYTPGSSALLAWRRVQTPAVYRVTVSRDAQGKEIVRRLLVADARVDLQPIRALLQTGESYFWQVEAFTLKGRFVIAGPRQSFAAKQARTMNDLNWGLKNPLPEVGSRKSEVGSRKENAGSLLPSDFRRMIASTALPPVPNFDAEPEEAKAQDVALQFISRSPAPGQTVRSARPTVSAEFKSKVTAAEVTLTLDDTIVTALAEVSATRVSYTPVIPLDNGEHQVGVGAGAESVAWKFNVEASPAPLASTAATGTDAEADVAAVGANAPGGGAAGGAGEVGAGGGTNQGAATRQVNFETANNTQVVSGREADTNQTSVAAQASLQRGAVRFEMNGSGLVTSLISPRPRHINGQFNDYVFRVSREKEESPWGGELRFGVIVPQEFLNSEFVTTAIPREGVEAALRTPVGRFSFYGNTNDKGQGEGIGFGMRQVMRGAAYEVPFRKDRVKFRLMWLGASDANDDALKIGFDASGNPLNVGDPFAPRRAGDVFGGSLALQLKGDWQWFTEYALSSNNLNVHLGDPGRQFGRAWRTSLQGIWKKTNLNFALRDVTPNFASPANASFSQFSTSDRRGVDLAASRETKIGNLSATYQLLQSDFRDRNRAHVTLHNLNLNWTKNLTKTTILTVGGNGAFTSTANAERAEQTSLEGRADQRRLGLNTSLTQTFGKLQLTVGGTRNWLRDRVNEHANNIVTSLNFSGNWAVTSYFQLHSNVSVNWTAGEKFSAGGSRTLTVYLQPTINWKRTGLSFIPLFTVNDMNATLGTGVRLSNTLMTQYGGRVAWQAPGQFRYNTFSVEGSQTCMRDGLQGTRNCAPRLLFLWTMVRPVKPTE